MKLTKIYSGIMALLIGAAMTTACSDNDDYWANSGTLLKDGSVVTGSSDVTATTATFHGTVTGLENMNPSSYSTGFKYGFSQNALTETATSASSAEFSASLAGLMNNQVIYYQAYVTLQGRLTYTGEVKSLVTTDATATTGTATNVDFAGATLAGAISKYPDNATAGIVISMSNDEETVRSGLRLANDKLEDSYAIVKAGLLPSTTYYYAAYLDLGPGVVYGEVKQFTTAANAIDVDEEFVDLGLSVKWAKRNIGARTETELGGLFAFGDVTGCNPSINPADYASTDIYKTDCDVANIALGGKATLPTADLFEELFRLCRTEWTEQNGVSGYKVTGKNGNSIFLPAAGKRVGSETGDEGTHGYYLTGTVNTANNQFAVDYEFSSSSSTRSTRAVYEALSVRAVSTARNMKLNKSLLYNTWEIDIKDDGSTVSWAGPVFFYGTDDSWRTLTNGEPIVGDSWAWEADATQTWAWDGIEGCKGSMTIYNVDGKDSVSVTKIMKDGTSTTQKGTVTIDEANFTITSDVDLLVPTNFTDGFVNNRKTAIKIMQQSDKKLQLGFFRDADPCTLGVNYVPQLEKYGYTAKLTCYGDGVNGDCSDGWNSAMTTIPGTGVGTYTLTFNAVDARVNGKVYVIDIEGFAAANPNAYARVDAIWADGQEVPFDQNKFFFGDIEGQGNYRIEMANIWGCGHNDGWNGLKDTPFHAGGGETTNETALAFSKTFAVQFTIVSLNADLSFTAKQTAVGLDDSWNMAGNWGKENAGAVTVVYNNERRQYELKSTNNVSLTLDAAADCDGVGANVGAVNLVDIVGIRSYFPGFSAQLVSVVNDGVNVPFDNAKIKYGDIENNGNFRIELHNIWGSGTAADPAFSGVTSIQGNNCVTSLGFKTSSVYTIGNFSNKLYAVPQGWEK